VQAKCKRKRLVKMMFHYEYLTTQHPPSVFWQQESVEEISPLERELRSASSKKKRNDAIDRGIRFVCCYPFFAHGCRQAYPSDPFFEPTIIDHFKVRQKLTETEAREFEEAILDASPRVKPSLCCLTCTSDTSFCGTVPRSEDAREGFRIIRKAKLNTKNGRLLLTVSPEFYYSALYFMNNFENTVLKKGGTEHKFKLPIPVISRPSMDPFPQFHLVEAIPIENNDNALSNSNDDYFFTRPDHIPMATVLYHTFPSSPCPNNPHNENENEEDGKSSDP